MIKPKAQNYKWFTIIILSDLQNDKKNEYFSKIFLNHEVLRHRCNYTHEWAERKLLHQPPI